MGRNKTGIMLDVAKNDIVHEPWTVIRAALSLFVVVPSFNLLGDGLRDALDPRHA
jgi:peptide/nickel transport system permease protein